MADGQHLIIPTKYCGYWYSQNEWRVILQVSPTFQVCPEDRSVDIMNTVGCFDRTGWSTIIAEDGTTAGSLVSLTGAFPPPPYYAVEGPMLDPDAVCISAKNATFTSGCSFMKLNVTKELKNDSTKSIDVASWWVRPPQYLLWTNPPVHLWMGCCSFRKDRQ